MNGYIIRVYGKSANYYVASAIGGGTLRIREAHIFASQDDARAAAVALYARREIGHWEVKAAPPQFFPAVS